jgi:hypothetical protein
VVESSGLLNRFQSSGNFHQIKQIPFPAKDLQATPLHSFSRDFTGFDGSVVTL